MHKNRPGSEVAELAAVGAILVCYGLSVSAPAMGLLHDDGLYAVTSKALGQNQGYRIISLPEEIWQTKAPPLFPLVLSFLWRIAPSFPENTTLLKLVPLIASFAWWYLIYLLVLRETSLQNWGRTIALLTAASPQVLFYSTTLMTETLFAVFVWTGLLLIRSCEEENVGWARTFLAAAVCAAAFYTRILGVTLGIAGAIALARRHGFGRAIRFSGLVLIFIAPWIAWTAWKKISIDNIYAYYTGTNYWRVLLRNDLSDKLEMMGNTFLSVLFSPGWLMGLSSPWLWPLLALVSVLTILGYCLDARRGVNVIHVFLLIYLATVTLWTWMPLRYVVPVLPLLLLLAGKGTLRAVSRFGSLSPDPFRALVCAVALVAGVMLVAATYRTVRSGVVCPTAPCAAKWSEVRGTLAQVRERTPPDAILAGNLDPLLYLYTGRKAIRYFEQDPNLIYYNTDNYHSKHICENLKKRITQSGADFLVALPVNTSSEVRLRELIGDAERVCPSALQIVSTGPYCCLYNVRAWTPMRSPERNGSER